jgi:flavin-dependent dehydrogenase
MTPGTWDAIVIGAGPAGSLSACLLARTGARVLLVERQAFPRAKVCGGCLNTSAIASLDRAGLGGRVRALGARPTRAIEVSFRSRVATLPLPPGVAVSRAALDAELAAAAGEAGAVFAPQTTAIVAGDGAGGADEARRRVSLQPREGRPAGVRARVVLAADGLAASSLRECAEVCSRTARHARVGVGGLAPAGAVAVADGTITMAVDRHGYVGAVEIEDGRVNVAAAFDPAFLKGQGGPARAIPAVLARAGVSFRAEIGAVAWTGTVPLSRRTPRPAARRLFVLGDAAGYVEPFTGEGVAWALAAAEAVVPLARRAIVSWDEGLEREWVGDAARRARSRQRLCRAVARGLRAPWLVASAVTLLRRWPELARPALAHLAPRASAS